MPLKNKHNKDEKGRHSKETEESFEETKYKLWEEIQSLTIENHNKRLLHIKRKKNCAETR